MRGGTTWVDIGLLVLYVKFQDGLFSLDGGGCCDSEQFCMGCAAAAYVLSCSAPSMAL